MRRDRCGAQAPRDRYAAAPRRVQIEGSPSRLAEQIGHAHHQAGIVGGHLPLRQCLPMLPQWTDTTWSSLAPARPASRRPSRRASWTLRLPSWSATCSAAAARSGSACRRKRCCTRRPAHHAGGDYPWSKASAFRDYMINRVDRDYPDDTSHVKALKRAGAETVRGEARFVGADPLTLEVRDASGAVRALEAGAVVLAVGSHSRIPDVARPKGIRPLDEPRGNVAARAAGWRGGAGRRSQRRRAWAGLRPLRRAGDDRPSA